MDETEWLTEDVIRDVFVSVFAERMQTWTRLRAEKHEEEMERMGNE